MPRSFWKLAAAWVLLAVVSAPFVLELLDGSGIGIVIPGLPVSATEAVLIGGLGLAGPLVLAAFMRRRRAL